MGPVGIVLTVLWAGLGLLLLGGAGRMLHRSIKERDSTHGLMVAVLGLPGLFIAASIVVQLVGDEDGAPYSQDARTTVDRKRTIGCVAEVREAEGLPSLVGGSFVHRLRLQVQIEGRPTYETDSRVLLSPLEQGELGARLGNERRKYHCLADREKPQRVEVLMDRPIG